jgi:hypothetical protein
MRVNSTYVRGAVAGLLLGAIIAFAATKYAMASKQVDTLVAGVFWGCRNALAGRVLTDEKRCLELSEDIRGMARQTAYCEQTKECDTNNIL